MMKKPLIVILCSVLIAAGFCTAKFALFPLLTQNSESGVTRIVHDDDIDTLFIGSSMFRQGIDTTKLLDGKSSFLLAYNGNQPWTEDLILEYLFNSGKKPDTVFIDMYAYTISDPEIKISDNRLLMHLPFRSVCDTYSVLKQNGAAGVKELYEMFVTSNNELFVT